MGANPARPQLDSALISPRSHTKDTKVHEGNPLKSGCSYAFVFFVVQDFRHYRLFPAGIAIVINYKANVHQRTTNRRGSLAQN
jgi:hypothetical protein